MDTQTYVPIDILISNRFFIIYIQSSINTWGLKCYPMYLPYLPPTIHNSRVEIWGKVDGR